MGVRSSAVPRQQDRQENILWALALLMKKNATERGVSDLSADKSAGHFVTVGSVRMRV